MYLASLCCSELCSVKLQLQEKAVEDLRQPPTTLHITRDRGRFLGRQGPHQRLGSLGDQQELLGLEKSSKIIESNH